MDNSGLLILLVQFLGVHGLVFGVHHLRNRFGLIPFFVLIGGLTSLTTWSTDAGVAVHVGGHTFLVGSAVFYTSILMGVFITYVFEGVRAARTTILTMIGVGAATLVTTYLLRVQAGPAGAALIPIPSLRTNAAGIASTLCAFIFLGVAWQFLHNKWGNRFLPIQAFLTILGVMWLDMIIFNVVAFAGQAHQWNMLKGAALTRFASAALGAPLLAGYMLFKGERSGLPVEKRPVFAILQELHNVSSELYATNREVNRLLQITDEQRRRIIDLEETIDRARRLGDLLPICIYCKKIRNEDKTWLRVDEFFADHAGAKFTHTVCPDCAEYQFPKSTKDKTRAE